MNIRSQSIVIAVFLGLLGAGSVEAAQGHRRPVNKKRPQPVVAKRAAAVRQPVRKNIRPVPAQKAKPRVPVNKIQGIKRGAQPARVVRKPLNNNKPAQKVLNNRNRKPQKAVNVGARKVAQKVAQKNVRKPQQKINKNKNVRKDPGVAPRAYVPPATPRENNNHNNNATRKPVARKPVQRNHKPAQPKQNLVAQKRCNVCFMEYPTNEFLTLSCTHANTCTTCLRHTLNAALQDKDSRKLCCTHYSCRKQLSPAEIHKILKGDTAMLKQYHEVLTHEYLLKQKLKQCPTPDCKHRFLNEKECAAPFNCPDCKKTYCGKCLIPHNHATTCEAAAAARVVNPNEKANEEWMQNNAKNCPRCGMAGQKEIGCDHITCTQCKHEYCWLCLEPHDHDLRRHMNTQAHRAAVEKLRAAELAKPQPKAIIADMREEMVNKIFYDEFDNRVVVPSKQTVIVFASDQKSSPASRQEFYQFFEDNIGKPVRWNYVFRGNAYAVQATIAGSVERQTIQETLDTLNALGILQRDIPVEYHEIWNQMFNQ